MTNFAKCLEAVQCEHILIGVFPDGQDVVAFQTAGTAATAASVTVPGEHLEPDRCPASFVYAPSVVAHISQPTQSARGVAV